MSIFNYLCYIILGILLFYISNNIENLEVELNFDGTNHYVDITDLNEKESSFSLKDNGFEILNLKDKEHITTLTEQFYSSQPNPPPEINTELLELIKIHALVNIEDDNPWETLFCLAIASSISLNGIK